MPWHGQDPTRPGVSVEMSQTFMAPAKGGEAAQGLRLSQIFQQFVEDYNIILYLKVSWDFHYDLRYFH